MERYKSGWLLQLQSVMSLVARWRAIRLIVEYDLEISALGQNDGPDGHLGGTGDKRR